MALSPQATSRQPPGLHWLAGSTQTYVCETRSVLRVNKLGMENLVRTTAQVQVLAKMPASDGYAVRVEVLHTEQSQQQGLHQLAAALNVVSEVLEIEVDAFGYARRILNRPELQAKWPGVRAALARRFRAYPQTDALLAGLDQQLVVPGALETAILPNGLYGMLFAGLLGRAFPPLAAALPEERLFPHFFGNLDLPLTLYRYAAPDNEQTINNLCLDASAELATDSFDAASWRQLLRQITDTPSLDTSLALTYHDAYTLGRLDGVVQAATQQLRAEVPKVYLNELTHRLTLQAVAA